MDCQVREMKLEEANLMIDYFLGSDLRFLDGMGVDPDKLPSQSEWFELLRQDFAMPMQQRKFFYLVWDVEGSPIGHCNINRIVFGETAYMHLHIWNGSHRRSGVATRLLRQSITRFFEQFELERLYCEPYARNPAPNQTLPKHGFQLIKTYETTPGWIAYFQPVNLWELGRETVARWSET